MKTLGNTPTGGLIIELTSDEACDFLLLQKVSDGDSFLWDTAGRSPRDRDMTPIFAAIRLWIMAKLNVNTMRNAIEQCEKVLINNQAIVSNNQIRPEENKNSS